jgi:hypothetical protein
MVECHGCVELEAMDRHSSFNARPSVDLLSRRFRPRRCDWRYGRRFRGPSCPIYSCVLAPAPHAAADQPDPCSSRCALGFIFYRKSRPQCSTCLNVTGDCRYCTHLGTLLALLKGYGCTVVASSQTTSEVNPLNPRQHSGKPRGHSACCMSVGRYASLLCSHETRSSRATESKNI